MPLASRMPGQLIPAALRQLVCVLVETAPHVARSDHVAADLLHVGAAGFAPVGDPRLGFVDACLARWRKLGLVLLEAISEGPGAGLGVGAELLDVLPARAGLPGPRGSRER